jgi:hypothetical protein
VLAYREEMMRLLRVLILGTLLVAACSSSDSSTGAPDEHGCAPGATYCHGCNGSGFCSMGGCPGFQCAEPIAEGGTADGSAGSAGSGGTTGAGGASGSGGSAGVASDGGTCDATFKDALVKDCQSETDCALVNHNDCCGTIVVAVKKGTEATFAAADSAYRTCVPGCGLRGCLHQDMSEDLKSPSPSQAIVAVCDNKLCMSTVR